MAWYHKSILVFYIGKDEVATRKSNRYSQNPGELLVVRFIQSFTIKNIYGIVPSKTMEGLCQVKAEDQN